jgi:TPR repeat protein
VSTNIEKCFEILGLEPGASLQTVKETYRKIVKAWHPDRFHNNPKENEKAHSILKEVNPAYKTLRLFFDGHLRLEHAETDFTRPVSAAQQFDFGIKYAYGDGVLQNNDEAIKWIRKAAEQGYAKAQNCLGTFYYWGDRVAQDVNECIKWFRKAAKQNYEPSQIWLENIYADGWGAPEDFSEKIRWYREAAAEGFVTAQRRLGNFYSNGEGENIPKDYWEAIKWFIMAAENGDMESQVVLTRSGGHLGGAGRMVF